MTASTEVIPTQRDDQPVTVIVARSVMAGHSPVRRRDHSGGGADDLGGDAPAFQVVGGLVVPHEILTSTSLTPATQAARLEYQPFPGQKVNIGYGLGCERLNEFIGHHGAVLGFSTVVMRRPQVDVTIAAVANESTNFTTPTSSFAYAVIQTLYPDLWV